MSKVLSMTIKEHKILQETIDKLVWECLVEMACGNSKKALTEDKKKNPDGAMKNKRAEVMRWLKDNVINNAEIMRKLWPGRKKFEDSKRSKFSKKVRGKDNEGKPYKFSDSEISRLYSIKASLG